MNVLHRNGIVPSSLPPLMCNVNVKILRRRFVPFLFGSHSQFASKTLGKPLDVYNVSALLKRNLNVCRFSYILLRSFVYDGKNFVTERGNQKSFVNEGIFHFYKVCLLRSFFLRELFVQNSKIEPFVCAWSYTIRLDVSFNWNHSLPKSCILCGAGWNVVFSCHKLVGFLEGAWRRFATH